jgi:hypothetical protein
MEVGPSLARRPNLRVRGCVRDRRRTAVNGRARGINAGWNARGVRHLDTDGGPKWSLTQPYRSAPARSRLAWRWKFRVQPIARPAFFAIPRVSLRCARSLAPRFGEPYRPKPVPNLRGGGSDRERGRASKLRPDRHPIGAGPRPTSRRQCGPAPARPRNPNPVLLGRGHRAQEGAWWPLAEPPIESMLSDDHPVRSRDSAEGAHEPCIMGTLVEGEVAAMAVPGHHRTDSIDIEDQVPGEAGLGRNGRSLRQRRTRKARSNLPQVPSFLTGCRHVPE